MFTMIRMVSLATFCLIVSVTPVCANNTQNVQRLILPDSNVFKTIGARVTFEKRTVWKVLAIDDIDTTELTYSNFQTVTQFKNVEALSFSSLHTNTSVSILSQLKLFPQLKRLSLYGLGFDDEIACLKQIGSLTNLNELVLSYPHLSDANLKELAGLKNLQVLNLGDHHCKSNCFESIIYLKNLRKLILSTTSLKSKDIMLLRELPYLQNLSIGLIDNVEPRNSLIDLSSLTNLMVLETNISCDEKAPKVRPPKNLRVLNVRLFSDEHNTILPEWIRHVRWLNIKSLKYGNELTRNDFEVLNSLTNLNELSIHLSFENKQTEQECMQILSHMRVPVLTLDFYCTQAATMDEWAKFLSDTNLDTI